jgi:PEP-CTERM motif
METTHSLRYRKFILFFAGSMAFESAFCDDALARKLHLHSLIPTIPPKEYPMKSRLLKYVSIVFLISGNLAHAAWTSFSIDSVNAPLAAPNHMDITNLAPFSLPLIVLGGLSTPAGTPLFSFRNATSLTLDDFHMTLRCTRTADPDSCDAGQPFGPGAPSSDIFNNISGNVPGVLNGEVYTWNFNFSGGNVLPGDFFAIVDQGNALGRAPRVLEITANASIPEPGSALLILLGLAGMVVVSRRKFPSV